MTKNELKYVNSLKEENERVKNMLICFMDALGKVRNVADIEDISLIPIMSELNKQYRAEIKAEAYKEAFGKLKEKKRTMLDYDEAGFSSKITVVSIEEIDNLLNELVGDGDGKRKD